MGMWKEMKKRIYVPLVLIVIWAICMWCAGCGKVLRGGCLILEGVGDGISAGATYAAESLKENE